MSKPLAAKDMGACTFRHVLITRLSPACLEAERRLVDGSANFRLLEGRRRRPGPA